MSYHIRHAILGKIITHLPITQHGDDAGKGVVGVEVIFVPVPEDTVSTASYMKVQDAHVSRKIPIPVK